MPVAGTYSGDPAASPADAVRCMLGDVGPDFLLSDDEIAYFDKRTKASYDDPIMTAAVCADILAGRFAAEVSISADGVSISAEQLQDRYLKLAASLRTTYKVLAAPGGLPIAGGIDAFSIDDPTVKPYSFGVGMNDNPRAGSQDPSSAPLTYAQLESEPW